MIRRSVDPEDAPARVMKGLARHPVPVMILARLAVDRDHQGKGLGKALDNWHATRDSAMVACYQVQQIDDRRCVMSTASKRPAARKLLNKVTANAAESDCIVYLY